MWLKNVEGIKGIFFRHHQTIPKKSVFYLDDVGLTNKETVLDLHRE